MAQRTSPPSKAELAQVTERGRQLAQYDIAAWYATYAVVATKPDEGLVDGRVQEEIDDVCCSPDAARVSIRTA
jgi:hypothetical protein